MINYNLKKKKERYELTKENLTEKYNKQMKVIDRILYVINNKSEIKENDEFETIVFKKYLELENVSAVAKCVNDLGYRIKTDSYVGERKYMGTDITEILISDVNIDEDIKEVVQYLQDKNYRAILKVWG